MKPKSIKLNMILNAIKGLMGIIFPLITFPYVSRILGVDNLGRYNFAYAMISYFILIAGLGISAYAIREGARFREDKHKFHNFADEMLSINAVSTIIAYILLLVVMAAVPKLGDYQSLLIILSLQIGFKTIGIEWIYSIYEDYAYITIRSILFQLISLVLMFAFVKTENDINIYAAITVFSAVDSNVFNYVYARKYCKVRLKRHFDWKRHIKPIMVLFAMSVAVTIYVSSDTTILGFLTADYNVGIYSVSAKVYGIVKTILSSVLIVSIPVLSALLGEDNRDKFSAVASEIYKMLITVMLPSVAGMILLRREIVMAVSGIEYMEAVPSLVILSVSLIFCMGAWFWGQCILVPARKENIVFKATIVSAIANIGLNFVLIPFWKEDAAAFTTLLAEAIVFFWCRHDGGKVAQLNGILSVSIKAFIGSLSIFAVGSVLKTFSLPMNGYICVTILCSIVLYFGMELILKNEVAIDIWRKCMIKIKR